MNNSSKKRVLHQRSETQDQGLVYRRAFAVWACSYRTSNSGSWLGGVGTVIRIVVNATSEWRLTALAIGLSLGIIEERQEDKGNLKMTLIRWQPFQELETLRRQMDHIFDEMNGLKNTSAISWQPAIEVQDADDNVILRAEIPGIEAKDLDVRVTREAVSLSGEHRYEQKTQAKGFFRSEFRYGKFGRVIPLPVAVQNDQVKADFSNGILTLTLPKVEALKNRVVKLNLTESVAAIEANSEQPSNAEYLAAIEANSEQSSNAETGDVWDSSTETAAV